MNREELQRMYGSTPQSFRNRMEQALSAQSAQPAETAARGMGRRGLRLALAAALIVALLAAVAIAASLPSVRELFGNAYGARVAEKIDEGAAAYPAQSFRLGDVIYSVDEVVDTEDGLLGVGHITPANDGVVLMAEDYTPDDAAGYGLHFGEESLAPEGAPTYAQVAAEKDAKLVMAGACAEAVGVDGGEILTLACTGYEAYPQRDGSIQFAFELPRGVEVEQGTRYAIRFWVNNCEVSPDGELDEETYQGEEWTIEIEPTRKEAQ